MASTLQFDQVIDASNINTVGDIDGTSLPHEVWRQVRIEVIPPPIQRRPTKPQELTEQFLTEWNSTIKAITQRILVGTIMEDNGTIKIPSMQCLTAQEESRNKYGCYTYATTEALYIGTTYLQTNTDTSRYDYGRQWHHWTTFNAMPNSSRSKPQQVRMSYLCNDGSVVYRDNTLTNEYGY